MQNGDGSKEVVVHQVGDSWAGNHPRESVHRGSEDRVRDEAEASLGRR